MSRYICIFTASMNVGAGKSCTLLWPYTEICASGLMCTQCGENAYNVGTCVNSPTSGSNLLYVLIPIDNRFLVAILKYQ